MDTPQQFRDITLEIQLDLVVLVLGLHTLHLVVEVAVP